MAFSGVSDRDNLFPLLRRMISSKVEVLKFAVAASGPKDGLLYLNKKDKLKKVDEASQTLATLAELVARVLKEPGVAPAAIPDGAVEADLALSLSFVNQGPRPSGD